MPSGASTPSMANHSSRGCALRLGGMTAPIVLDSPMNGRAILAYAEQVLAPTLARCDIVIMDNLSAHEAAGGRRSPKRQMRGCTCCRLAAPTSPIELAFSKFKSILRQAAARTIPEIWTTIGKALPEFEPGKCVEYFTACGYEPE